MAKRISGLWPKIIQPSSLLEAAERACAGKKNRPDVARFLLNMDMEIIRLHRELSEGTYQPGQYQHFRIRDPKPRWISAAPIRDRVVHHALTGALEPIWETRYLSACFACRKGKGVHAALRYVQKAAAKYKYALKCDIRKYFASIDHALLMEEIKSGISCRPTLNFVEQLLRHQRGPEEFIQHFPGDNLFTPLERDSGIPLGNQTSQFFANVYLNRFDHFVQRQLRPAAYFRYVDDFGLFGDSKEELWEMRQELIGFLASLRLRLHEGKSRCYPIRNGVTFLGWRIFPGHSRLSRSGVIRFRRRLRQTWLDFQDGTEDWKSVECRVHGLIGHLQHGDTWALRRRWLSAYPFILSRRSQLTEC